MEHGPSLSNLVARLSADRAGDRRVVFTNGVFDLIHPGHVRSLRAARSLGDILVVAINSDASVKRLKGPLRPILPQRERLKIVAALEPVDHAILFEDDTPLETILALRPDVLAKGGDYTPDTIVGREEVESWGGLVTTIPLVAGLSSSGVVERIMETALRL